MTGIRSWTAEVTALGVVVRIEQVLSIVSLGSFQPIPQSREREQLPVVDFEAVRLLGFPVSLPLVKAVRRNQAPAGFQSIAERGLRGRRFRPCVDHAWRRQTNLSPNVE